MRRRTFLKGSLATAAAAWLGSGPAREHPFVVGTSVSRSGPYASFAEPIERALRLWAERVDDASGFGGRGVVLRIADDASDPDAARRAFEDLGGDVDAWIAPYGSRLTGAVLPIAEHAGVPLLAPSAGDRSLWREPRSWSVQILNPIDTMLWSSLELAAERGLATVALVHRADPFSEAVFAGAERRAPEVGLRVALRRRYRDEGEARAALEAVADAGAALLVAMGFRPGGSGFGFRDDALLLRRLIADIQPRPDWTNLGIAVADASFAAAAPGDVEGLFGTTGWRTYLPTPGNRALIGRYRDRWGTAPDTHAAQAYAAGELLIRAYRLEHSAEPDALRNALFNIDAETVFGRYAVAGSGLQVGKENAVVQWQGGEPQAVYPPRYQTAPLMS